MYTHLSVIASIHLQHKDLPKAIGGIEASYGGLLGWDFVMKRREACQEPERKPFP